MPQSNGYSLAGSKETFLVPYRGVLFADATTHPIVRLQMNCFDIPPASEYRALDLSVDYKLATVGNRQAMLPSHSHLFARTPDGETLTETAYRSYRRFSSDAAITFEEEGSSKP